MGTLESDWSGGFAETNRTVVQSALARSTDIILEATDKLSNSVELSMIVNLNKKRTGGDVEACAFAAPLSELGRP